MSLDTSVKDLKLLTACFCSLCGLKDFEPACAEKSVCLCIKTKAECELVQPTTCCKSQEVTCCLDCRSALPPDKEVPCMFGVLGFICFGQR